MKRLWRWLFPPMTGRDKWLWERNTRRPLQINDNIRRLFPGRSDEQIRQHYETVRTHSEVKIT